MESVTIKSSGRAEKTYSAIWATDVIGSNLWNALLNSSENIVDVVRDFSGAEEITVEDEQTGSHVYKGYTRFAALNRHPDGILITLAKDDADG